MNYDDLKTELRLIEAAQAAVTDSLSKQRKPGAPLLANLIACGWCGHESRFVKDGPRLVCEGCGNALDAERMRGPVPHPPFPLPYRDAASAEHGAPVDAAAGLPHPTQPESDPGNLSSPDQAANHPHGAGGGLASDFSDHKPGSPW